MKKNYTLKLVLAMLVVVLVSLVSFVGVYKGKNLLKEYSLGKDFSKRKVATFSVKEEQQEESNSEENTSENSEENKTEENATENSVENQENTTENNSEEQKESNNSENNESKVVLTQEQKKENYKKAKENISKRLTAMKSEEYDIRLNEDTGNLVIEVPENIDTTYLAQIVTKGKVQIKNTSSSEVIVDGNAFKNASARMDSATYSKPIVVLNMKFTKDAINKISSANTKYTDSNGAEDDATFAVVLDDNTLYSDKATSFISSAQKGELDLVMGENDEGKNLEEDYQRALAITAIMKCGEISVEYETESINLIDSDINIKSIVIISIIIGVLMLIFAIYKFKAKGILPVISLVGLVATILLVLRYTNVRITLFTILGLAIIVLINYIIILKTLNSDKSLKENIVSAFNNLIPCMIVAIVFCCAPYLQLASFGMTIFWGLIIMCIYNSLITRIFVEK